MAYTIAQVTTELNTDPRGIGYAASVASGSVQELSRLLNTAPQPSGTGGAVTVFKPYTDLSDAVAAVVAAEYTSLTAAQKALWTDLVTRAGPRGIKSGDANMRATIVGIFPVGATRTALTALASRPASRAEELWGVDVRVPDQDIAAALGTA